MTRGRKKDLTIPPTRALTQQRDYRARKAKYLSDLEERCRKAEEENIRLKKEIEALKAQSGISAAGMRYNPEMVQATTELMRHVVDTQASLAHFQQVMISRPHLNRDELSAGAGAASHFSVAPASPTATFQLPTPPSVSPQTLAREVLASLPHINIPPSVMPSPDTSTHAGDEQESMDEWQRADDWRRANPSSRRSESPCCGGIMDCTGLIESEDEDSTPRGCQMQKMSELRSTSGGSPEERKCEPSSSTSRGCRRP